ncbi:MAG: metallophosphoesterase [Candidatus Jordarchaeales archaeon]
MVAEGGFAGVFDGPNWKIFNMIAVTGFRVGGFMMGDGSIIVISDCHLGLVSGGRTKGVVCEPDKLGQFLSWLIRLERGEKFTVALGPWGGGRSEKVLKAPEKVILLGDIVELWDAADREVDQCSRPIFDLLGRMRCEKIYVLGNHDYDLKSLVGTYPSGEQTLKIVEECYPEQVEDGRVVTLEKGDRGYLFVHGYQFDKIFRFHPWKLLPGVRSGAIAFGKYGDVFVALLIISVLAWLLDYFAAHQAALGATALIQTLLLVGFPAQLAALSLLSLSGYWATLHPVLSVLGNSALILLWAILGGPRIVYLYGRRVWSRLVGTRYNREASIRGLHSWWRRFSRGRAVDAKNLRVVYGHTHLIDMIPPEELAADIGVNVTALNIPAWVKDYTEKHRQKLRAACLYIDDEDELFIGWDWNERRPFLIPVEAVYERRKNGKISEGTAEKLLSIGWPKSMVDTWLKVKIT